MNKHKQHENGCLMAHLAVGSISNAAASFSPETQTSSYPECYDNSAR